MPSFTRNTLKALVILAERHRSWGEHIVLCWNIWENLSLFSVTSWHSYLFITLPHSNFYIPVKPPALHGWQKQIFWGCHSYELLSESFKKGNELDGILWAQLQLVCMYLGCLCALVSNRFFFRLLIVFHLRCKENNNIFVCKLIDQFHGFFIEISLNFQLIMENNHEKIHGKEKNKDRDEAALILNKRTSLKRHTRKGSIKIHMDQNLFQKAV